MSHEAGYGAGTGCAGERMDTLDMEIVDEVRDALGDAAYLGYANRMLEEMRALGPELLKGLGGDAESLAQRAHRAAGSAVSVGAKALHGRLKDIENAARAGEVRLTRLVESFDAVVAETEAAIGALRLAP